MTCSSLTVRFLAIAVIAACSPAPPPPVRAPEPPADPVPKGTTIRFVGQVILAGTLADETEGALILSIRAIGSRDALLRRSYPITDPTWAQRSRGRALSFGLDVRDALDASPPTFGRHMELVARYDADGNPATDEAGSIERAFPARTGDVDIDVTLERADTDPPRAASAGPR